MDLDCVSQYKNCVKGIPCGNTCISKGKNCKPKPNAQINAVANLLVNPDNLEKGAEKSSEEKKPLLEEKYPVISSEDPEMFSKETEIGNNTIATTIAGDFFQTEPSPPPVIQIIGIEVNGRYDKTASIEGKDGLKLALASREHVREYVKSAPEGTILSNTPHTKDGFGDQRARLYEKAGFSPPNKDNAMYSIVSGGKNIPITLDEIIALKESGHIK